MCAARRDFLLVLERMAEVPLRSGPDGAGFCIAKQLRDIAGLRPGNVVINDNMFGYPLPIVKRAMRSARVMANLPSFTTASGNPDLLPRQGALRTPWLVINAVCSVRLSANDTRRAGHR
jgi:hypothetical protein